MYIPLTYNSFSMPQIFLASLGNTGFLSKTSVAYFSPAMLVTAAKYDRKRAHVHEEFSTPQLPNKYLLITTNWPFFSTNR